MTKKTPTPTAQHMQKLADLMDTRPEGVNLRQVQNTLSVSPPLAKAALIEIGAVEQDGKWVFAEPVTIAESAPVELVTIEPELVIVDWTNAPEGATHWHVVEKIWLEFDGEDFVEFGSGYIGSYPNGKDLRERVYVGDESHVIPTAYYLKKELEFLEFCESIPQAKSDLARVLEAERQRVFDAAAIGGTVERLAEVTGLHVDDVQQHLDALIVDGVIYQKPIIVAMSYGVMG